MEGILHNSEIPDPDHRDLIILFLAYFLPKILFIAGIVLITLTLYGGLFQ